MAGIMDMESVGYGDRRLIDPWDAIKADLIQQLDADPVTFNQVLQSSVIRLQGRVSIHTIQRAEEYFGFLWNNLGSEDEIIDFLISLMDYLQFHTELGTTRYADILMEHKKRLTQYKIEQARSDEIYGMRDFVGRTKDIRLIIKTLTDPDEQYQGVSICGMGGVGKTTLAREICFRIKQRKEIWNIYQIDLREKETLMDLIRDTLVQFGFMCQSDDEDQLRKQLMQAVSSGIKTRTILFFDNMDEIMKFEKDSLLSFLEDLMLQANDNEAKTQIGMIMTVRQKLIPDKNIPSRLINWSRTDSRLTEKLVLELELKPLKEVDAITLLTKCTETPYAPKPNHDKFCRKIVKRCGYNPLAIRSVAATIKSGFVSMEKMSENLRSGKDIQNLTDVSKCLDTTFTTLQQRHQEMLVQLTVFHTVKFDIEAAASVHVCGEACLDVNKFIIIATKLDMLFLKSRHLIEIDDLTLSDDHQLSIMSSSNIQYSIHPLVYEFLKYKASQESRFHKVIKNAEMNFIHYFERNINRIVHQFDKDCMASMRIFKDNKVHAKNFYDLLLERDWSSRKIDGGENRLLILKRMHELADLIVDDHQKFRLLEKWVEYANYNGHFLEQAYWMVFQGLKFYETDRNEIARQKLSTVWNEVFPKVKASESEWNPVLGNFFFIRGRVLLQEGKLEDALQDFQNSKAYYSTVLKNYRLEYANVYNSIGSVHCRMSKDDFETARYHFQQALVNAMKIVQNFNNIDLPMYISNIGACLFKEGLNLHEKGRRTKAREKYEESVKYYDFSMKLDTQFDMDKFDSFAKKLIFRADAQARLGRMEKAEDDIERAMDIRRLNLSLPHDLITVTQHKVASIKRLHAIQLCVDDKKVEALTKMWEAIARYETVEHLMKLGGLSTCKEHKEYISIKTNHLWLLQQTNEKKKMLPALQFYKDYEEGKYDHIRNKRRTEKETTKYHLSHAELQALLRSGQLPQFATMGNQSSVEDDDAIFDMPEQEITLSPHSVKVLVAEALKEEKTVVNLNAALKSLNEDINHDLEGKEDFIEEKLKSVGYSINRKFEDGEIQRQLSQTEDDSADEMDVDCVDDKSSITFDQAEGRNLSRRTSELSTSSLEDEGSKKRAAFRKQRSSQGSRDDGTKFFLEEVGDTAQQNVKKHRLQRSSVDSSMEDDDDKEKTSFPVKKTFKQMRKTLQKADAIQEDAENDFNPNPEDEVQEEALVEMEDKGEKKETKIGSRRKHQSGEEIQTKYSKQEQMN